jgi:anti-sigma B factor antagonist
MEIETIKNEDGNTTVKLTGRLDTMTSSKLEEKLDDILGNTVSLTFDFADLEYISSAGLRIILTAQKMLTKKGGSVEVINCQPDVKEVFSITGFSEIIPIS